MYRDGIGRNICSRCRPTFLRARLKYLLVCLLFLLALDFFGVFTHFFESNYYAEFNYPLEGDVRKWAHQLQSGETPDSAPVNVQNFTLIYSSRNKCLSPDKVTPFQPRLVFIVKSARKNFVQRNAIRQSWGCEKRFSDVIIRTVFLLGTGNTGYDPSEDLQKSIDIEVDTFDDIVLGSFVDSYFNNTIKTIMGMRWAYENCPNSKFYMFVDDDFYVSTKNVLHFVWNPINYPEYLIEFKESPQKQDLSEADMLFAGFVINSAPHRHKSSKWHVSVSEYPWHMWPPYITGGAYILSAEALKEMYYISMFTQKFR